MYSSHDVARDGDPETLELIRKRGETFRWAAHLRSIYRARYQSAVVIMIGYLAIPGLFAAFLWTALQLVAVSILSIGVFAAYAVGSWLYQPLKEFVITILTLQEYNRRRNEYIRQGKIIVLPDKPLLL